MTLASKVLALSLLPALLVNCTQSHSAQNGKDIASGIIQGRDAQDSDVATGGTYNSVVGVLTAMSDTSAALCTGTLIAQDMILTAGHCLPQGTEAAKITIFFQAKVLNSQALQGSVKSFLVHADYAKDSDDNKDDLAIIRLATPAPASVKPAVLTSATLDLVNSRKGVAGYGQSDDRQNTPDDRNGTGVLRFTGVNDGSEILGSDQGKFASMLATDSSLTGTCHGDSGGPLFALDASTHQIVLAGVTDAGAPSYQGQEETDYISLVSNAKTPDDKKKALAAFYLKYPDAHICTGTDLYVNLETHLSWIQQTMTALRAQP